MRTIGTLHSCHFDENVRRRHCTMKNLIIRLIIDALDLMTQVDTNPLHSMSDKNKTILTSLNERHPIIIDKSNIGKKEKMFVYTSII